MGCSQSTPVQEPVAAAPASNASAAPVSAPGSQASAAAAPASNASKASTGEAVASVPTSSAAKKLFTISGVSITEEGTVFYHVEAADGSVSLKKRYNDFKQLYAQLANSSLLPPLPKANLGTLFKGKHNQEVIKEREQQFEVVLNAIANNAAFANAEVFTHFLAA